MTEVNMLALAMRFDFY